MQKTDFEALRIEFSERSRPIVFWTGAGVSSPAIPSWSGLRDSLLGKLKSRAQELNPTDKGNALSELAQISTMSDMWLQFERIEKALGKESYTRSIKDLIRNLPQLDS